MDISQQIKQKKKELKMLYADFQYEMRKLEKKRDLIVKKFSDEIDRIKAEKIRSKLKIN
jgi:hypothetical protein